MDQHLSKEERDLHPHTDNYRMSLDHTHVLDVEALVR